jgi:hypothetical protein
VTDFARTTYKCYFAGVCVCMIIGPALGYVMEVWPLVLVLLGLSGLDVSRAEGILTSTPGA